MNRPTTDAARSAIMRAVKSQDTVPEMQVRSYVHRLGFRFRLHSKSLPGKPDLVFPRLACVIFVHGCFWHGHGCPRGARIPKTNTNYWRTKIARNISRDEANLRRLKSLGWRVLVIWECEIKNSDRTEKRLLKFLRENPRQNAD
jgi:DNA mismatch endonuclease (patch repair protein)